MKSLRILIVCILFPWVALAQQQTEYNRKGDEALKRKDYRDAKMWFEEGVSYCDAYSIDKLTEIWLTNERMRPSMRSLMNKCLNCLNVRGTEQDTTAMHQLVLYYEKGIGASANEELAHYWAHKLVEARKPVELSYTTGQLKKERQQMALFVGYHYSIEAPYGLTIGGIKKYVGWYVRFKTNMGFDKYTTKCSDRNEGEIIGLSSNQSYYFTGNKKKNSYAVTAGMVIKCTNWLYTSVGFGYGSRTLLYEYRVVDYQTAEEEKDAAWAKHLDASKTGVAADWDMMLKFGKFFISAGCSTINFKYADLNAGAGVFF